MGEIQESPSVEATFDQALEEVRRECDKLFTAEEGYGRFVDMYNLYNMFINLKKISKKYELPSDDYMTYLQNFYNLKDIPLSIKNETYVEYIEAVYKYLFEFIKKSQPLFDRTKYDQEIRVIDYNQYEQAISTVFFGTANNVIGSTFEEAWNEGTLEGWEKLVQRATVTESDPLFCAACQKKFANENIFNHHKKGKKHIKAINNLANTHGNITTEALPKDIDSTEKNKLKRIAYLEYSIEKFYIILEDVFVATLNQIRKKQSRNYEEMAADEEDEKLPEPEPEKEEEEKPTRNPKNLPIGWDGKPIPYWFYKLHGLGVEYKCEICGGAVYYGRRAFERHFQEWRHAYGMKCLKIPNTIHFRDVTRIEDALKLYHKIMQDNYNNSFKPDLEEEFEDSQGNILNRKQYIDLQRQELL